MSAKESTSVLEKIMPENIDNNLSKLKKSEEALRSTERKYQRLVESLERDYIIYSHDADGNFTYVSPSVFNVLGYSQDEFMGHYAEYMTDSPINRDIEEHTNRALQGLKQEPYEAEFWHKNGNRIHLRVTEVPVFNDDGTVLGIEGIVQDITELKHAETEREELIQRLEKALREVKTLSGLLPICAHCKKIKDENNQWHQLESYVRAHTNADFTHGYCPECYKRELEKIKKKDSSGA